jgi:predicted nucleic acid-binding protein
LNRLVVDASVAVKWLPLFSHEPLVDAALYYLNRWSTRDLEFLVPCLFWIEVANVLWKTVHRGFCEGAEAESAILALLDWKLRTFPAEQLLVPTLTIAVENGRSVYDCSYLALALQQDAQFLTADEKLANALAARFPIKWLGAISHPK